MSETDKLRAEIIGKAEVSDEWIERLRTATMSLDAGAGSKVRYAFPDNGYKSDQEYAAEHLDRDSVYTVTWMNVGQSSSTVEIEELPGRRFNAVMFQDVEVNERTNW